MRRSLLVVACLLFVAGVIVGSSLRHGATAQSTDTERIAALETQVAELYSHDETLLNNFYQIANGALPGPDPAGYWLGNAYIYDHTKYEFDLLCTYNTLPGVIEVQFRCTQPAPR